MQPLAHSRVTVLKLHGDYADLEQRNTVDELETYPPAQQRLLERILEEYGLIVCGWSAEWDQALVRAIETVRSRRYPLFWSQYGRPGEVARGLTAQHRATVIEGRDADGLFRDLVRHIETLDHLRAAPITRDVAVAQLKRALPDPVRRIELSDLIEQATAQILEQSTPERRPVHAGQGDFADVFTAGVQGYRADSDTLLHLLAHGAFHDDGTHDQVWRRALSRLIRMRDDTPGHYVDSLEKLRHLPSLLTTWTIGVASVLSGREGLLVPILTRPEWTPPRTGRRRRVPVQYLNPLDIINADGLHAICHADNGNKFKYPQSHWLKDTLREPFRIVEPNDTTYEEACSRFEFLASMIAMDPHLNAHPWAGEFMLDGTWGDDGEGLASIVKSELNDLWPLLRADAFGGALQRAVAAHTALSDWRAQYGQRW